MGVDITVDKEAPVVDPTSAGGVGFMLGGPVGAALGTIGSTLFSQRSSRKARQHQEAREDSAYQRAAKDMEKAGLNRILALGGPSQSSGGGSAMMGNVGDALVSGSEQERKRNTMNEEKQLIQEQIANVASQTASNNAASARDRAAAALSDSTRQGVDYENKRRAVEADLYDTLGAFGIGGKKLLENLGGSSAKAIDDVVSGAASRARKRMFPSIPSKPRVKPQKTEPSIQKKYEDSQL